MSGIARDFRFRPQGNNMLWMCVLVAVSIHVGVLLYWKFSPHVLPVLEIEGDSVEVALVASAPASADATLPEPTPDAPVEPIPPVPEPVPREPEPVVPPKPPEMVQPAPAKPSPPPTPAAPSKPLTKPSRLPVRPAMNGTPGGSSFTTTGPNVGPAGATGKGAGKITGKPAFVVRPAAAYPEESRAAGEQGVVMLCISVNTDGRPTAVSVAHSSGFPRLDHAAVEGGWRCRVTSMGAAAQFDAPVRFNLRN